MCRTAQVDQIASIAESGGKNGPDCRVGRANGKCTGARMNDLLAIAMFAIAATRFAMLAATVKLDNTNSARSKPASCRPPVRGHSATNDKAAARDAKPSADSFTNLDAAEIQMATTILKSSVNHPEADTAKIRSAFWRLNEAHVEKQR
jgi:hypothetical protein